MLLCKAVSNWTVQSTLSDRRGAAESDIERCRKSEPNPSSPTDVATSAAADVPASPPDVPG